MGIEDFKLSSVKNKTILITGSSRGIGHALCEKLLSMNNSVIGTAKNIEHLNSISVINNDKFFPIQLDLESIDSIDLMVAEVKKGFDKIDVLINNASILGEMKTLEDYNYETWKNVININMNHQYYLTKNFLPLIKNSKKGSIINVSSSVGRFPREKWGAYSVSKVGLEALTEIFSQELKEVNIIVNSVNPGGTATDMRREAYPDEDQGQLPSPIDILPIFIYLASDDATESGMKFNAREYIGSMEF